MSPLGIVGIMTLIFGCIGGLGPLVVPKGQYRGVYQTMIVCTAVCLWLHWLLTYMSQLNPLFGPKLSTGQIYIMKWQWDQN